MSVDLPFYPPCPASPCLSLPCPTTSSLPLAIPISKRDSLLERDTMFRDFSGSVTRGPSHENGVDSHLTSRGGKPEQVRPRPSRGTL